MTSPANKCGSNDKTSKIARWLHCVGGKGQLRRKDFGGAEGIRTLDLLDAIEARSQLRHGPTEPIQFNISAAMRFPCERLTCFSCGKSCRLRRRFEELEERGIGKDCDKRGG